MLACVIFITEFRKRIIKHLLDTNRWNLSFHQANNNVGQSYVGKLTSRADCTRTSLVQKRFFSSSIQDFLVWEFDPICQPIIGGY